MNELIKLLRATKGSLEHPVYHPERTLSNHIALVTLKAYLLTNKNINFILAALLHDVCKCSDGELVNTSQGDYWQNRLHAKQATELINDNDDIKYLIHSFGGNIDLITSLVKHHMDKQVTKRNRHISGLETFFMLDDMINRHEQKSVVTDVYLPSTGKLHRNKHISFVGQSPIQIFAGLNRFTVTVSRTPFVFEFEDIPNFFNQEFYLDNEIKSLVEILF